MHVVALVLFWMLGSFVERRKSFVVGAMNPGCASISSGAL